MSTKKKVDLSKFDANEGLERGKPLLVEILWYFFKILFFLTALPWPSGIKVKILELFGAKIGDNVVIKPRVNIHFPWKLHIGDNSWLGEEVFILNFENISIGSNCCISQRAFLCGGNHDYKDLAFKFRNGPITIEDGVWVGASSFIAPNINIAEEAVITAGSIVYENMPSSKICSGNPCKPIKERWE